MCKYCESNDRQLFHEGQFLDDIKLRVVFDSDQLKFYRVNKLGKNSNYYCCISHKYINYCPMCGKKLAMESTDGTPEKISLEFELDEDTTCENLNFILNKRIGSFTEKQLFELGRAWERGDEECFDKLILDGEPDWESLVKHDEILCLGNPKMLCHSFGIDIDSEINPADLEQLQHKAAFLASCVAEEIWLNLEEDRLNDIFGYELEKK